MENAIQRIKNGERNIMRSPPDRDSSSGSGLCVCVGGVDTFFSVSEEGKLSCSTCMQLQNNNEVSCCFQKQSEVI